jgi:hypothetical protein
LSILGSHKRQHGEEVDGGGDHNEAMRDRILVWKPLGKMGRCRPPAAVIRDERKALA